MYVYFDIDYNMACIHTTIYITYIPHYTHHTYSTNLVNIGKARLLNVFTNRVRGFPFCRYLIISMQIMPRKIKGERGAET